MSPTRSFRTVTVLFALALLASPAGAGEIHPDLWDAIDAAGPGELVGALVMMEEQADIDSLKSYHDSISATRQMRNEAVVTTLMDTARRTQPRLRAALDRFAAAGAVKDVRPLWIVNALVLEATADVLKEIAKRDDVAMIYPNYRTELIRPVYQGPVEPAGSKGKGIEPGIQITGAPELWAMGIDGTGALVCDMDTGADGNHPAFASRWRGLEPGVPVSAAWYEPTYGTTFPEDWWGHGTHTLGTILGLDGDNQIGMAPGAKWIAAAVIDIPGGDTIGAALATMEWTTNPDGNPGTVEDVPDVTNNSWGIPGTNCEDTFWDALDNAEAAGTVYIWAAGNEGPFPRSLRSPADRTETDVNAFSTGALKLNGQRIANFSSRGPSDCEGHAIKPEVSAVGDNVRSSVPGGGYSEMSGTSMAAPHVSGLVALLRSAHPEATVDQIKYAILNNTVDLGDAGEDNTYGMGRIDAVGALGELGFPNNGGIKGRVTQKESGNPIPGTEITVEEAGLEQTTGGDGRYRFLIATAGEYTVTAYHPDYGSVSKTADVQIGPWTVVDFELSNVPVAGFTADKTEICAGESVQFTSTSSGLITQYVWSFGDGEISQEENPLHPYLIPGVFTVSLYTGGPTGEDTMEVADMISSFAVPVADFSASTTQAQVGEEIQFTDLSTGPATEWLWDFGDGTTATEQNPVKTYDAEGVYTVTLTATNRCGEQTMTKEGYITIAGEADDDAGDDAEEGDDDDDDGCGC